jgi:hypothetical protein
MKFRSALRSSHPTLSIVVATRHDANALEALLPLLAPVNSAYAIHEIIATEEAALSSAFEAATGDVVVTFPVDGSADLGTIPDLVDLLVAGDDVAKGSRFRKGGGSEGRTLFGAVCTRALHLICNAVLETKYTDIDSGYFAFWRDVVPAFDLTGSETPVVLSCRMASSKLRVTEVPTFESRIPGSRSSSALASSIRVLRTVLHEKRRDEITVDRRRSAEVPTPEFVTAPFRIESERRVA